MKKFVEQAIVFVMLLVIPMLYVELDLRSLNQVQWFNGYSQKFHDQNIDLMFMGSSLVSAAIRHDQLAEAISVKGEKPRSAINLGEGYTSPVEYLYGLRRLVEVNPHVLEDAIVVLPASGGLPDCRTWSDDWMAWQQPALLADYMTYPELWTYCTTLNVPMHEKLLLVGSKLSMIVAQGGLLRTGVMHALDVLADLIISGGKIQRSQVSIVAEGGIVTDTEFVALMRASVLKNAKRDLLGQQPIDWNKAVVKDIVEFVHAHGGTLYFCYIPLSTVQQAPLNTPTRRSDIKNFETECAKWGCAILRPDYTPLDDSEFPDLCHVSKEVSVKYTDALIKVFPKDKPAKKQGASK